MNYATRRMVELQAPWISDDHPQPLTRNLDPGRRISQPLAPGPTSWHDRYRQACLQAGPAGRATQQ
jgi:hypothetical protein